MAVTLHGFLCLPGGGVSGCAGSASSPRVAVLQTPLARVLWAGMNPEDASGYCLFSGPPLVFFSFKKSIFIFDRNLLLQRADDQFKLV